MDIRNILKIGLLFFFLSCGNEQKEYFKSGQIKRVYEIQNKKTHGKDVKYYENGQVKEELTWVYGEKKGPYKKYSNQGKLIYETVLDSGRSNGKSKYYYENGNVEADGFDFIDKHIGKWTTYSKKGEKKAYIEYFILNDSSFINQYWLLNKDGDTICDSSQYFITDLMSDTIFSNQQNELKILFNCGQVKGRGRSFAVEFFQTDRKFQFDEFTNIKYGEKGDINNKVHFVVSRPDTGKYYIKGRILEYSDLENDSTVNTYLYYFRIPFYVLKPDN